MTNNRNQPTQYCLADHIHESTNIGNNERSKAMGEVFGLLKTKIENMRNRTIGFGAKANG